MLKRKALEEDLALVLQKGVVHVADRVVESDKFDLGVRRVKATCMAADVESGKEIV